MFYFNEPELTKVRLKGLYAAVPIMYVLGEMLGVLLRNLRFLRKYFLILYN